MVKIYFGCSIRGGHSNVSIEELAYIVHEIKALGYTLMSELSENGNFIVDKDAEVHDLDYGWMKDADAGIFEISNPSLGVGAEVSDMVTLKKPVLCLYKKGVKKISRYIIGKMNSKYVKSPVEVYEYQTLGEAKYAIKKFMEEHVKK